MNELIKITEANGKKAVSARELHSFLESKKDFSSWIKMRIAKYDLIEDVDFVRFTQKGEANNATLIEYALSIDAAKELSMVEGNAKGKVARKYFIDIDKKYQEGVKVLTPAEQLLESVKLTVEHEREIKELKQSQSELSSKVNQMLEISQANEAAMKALPMSTEELPELPLRDKVRMMVNSYAANKRIDFKSVWDTVYTKLYYSYGISANAYKDVKKGQTKLDKMDALGHTPKLHLIVSDMCRNSNLLTL